MEDIEKDFGEEALLKMFSRDINHIPLLSREEEVALAMKARAGCEDSVNRLVEANLRFVLKIAFRFWRPGIPLMDLISEGCIGLTKAVRRFDPDLGYRILTYAEPAIRRHILAELGRDKKHDLISLDDYIYVCEDGDEITRKDVLISEESGADDLFLNIQVEGLLNRLSEREQMVLRLRIWEEKSLEDIADVLSLSKARTGQVEAGALRKLRWSIYKELGDCNFRNGIPEAYALSQ